MATKKLVLRALIALGILILAFGLYVGISLAKHMGLVEGEPIAKYTDPTEALVVIDVQTDLTSPDGKLPLNPSLTDSMIQKINLLVDRADAENKLVVYIRHEFEDDILTGIFTRGALKQGTPGAEIDPRVHMVSDQVFVKSIMDSFSNPNFDLFLRKNQVSDLVLTGIDAQACVDATLRSALSRGFGVTVVSNAIATSSRERLNEKLAEFETLGAKIVAAEQAFK
jgi:nicotinamidase-related amidase